MSSHLTITPPIPHLEFKILVPPGWERIMPPEQSPDFNDPKAFLALAIFRHEVTSAVVTVGARPAYGDGTVLDWLRYLSREQEFDVELCEPFATSGRSGVSIVATQQQEEGVLRMRVVLFEDGGSMFVLMGMAPVAYWPSAQGMMDLMLGSFLVTHPKGQTARLTPDDPELPPIAAVAPPEAILTSPEPAPAPNSGSESPATLSPQPPTPPSPSANSYAAFALSDDDATLSPEHPTNVSIRDSGAGLVPRVLRIDREHWVAFVGAGAIEAILPVPLGWHVIDDGKRTLMFDRLHDIQVNLDLIDPDDAAPEAIFNAILADVASESPDAKYNLIDLEGMPAMIVRDIIIDGATLQQVYVLMPVPHRPALRLKIRATVSDPQHIGLVGDLVERLVKDLQFLGLSVAPDVK